MQHIDVTHGPLDRKFDMATIKFFTAGGAGSDLRIPGLPTERAEQLRIEILQFAKDEFDSLKPEQISNDTDGSTSESQNG